MIYKIAGLTVKMNPQHEPLKSQAVPYLYIGKVSDIDCVIPQGEKVIKRYQEKNPALKIGDSEYLLYGAYLYDSLLGHQGIFLHASCVVYKGNAYLFSAPSGTGKSTHTQLWLKLLPGAFILNDDKPAIRYLNDQLYAFGTPFSGKADLSKNESYPIAGIAFIKRGQDNVIRVLNAQEVIPLFFSQTMLPHHEGRLNQMAAIIELIVGNIPIYELTCNMEEQAAMVSYEGMRPKEKRNHYE